MRSKFPPKSDLAKVLAIATLFTLTSVSVESLPAIGAEKNTQSSSSSTVTLKARINFLVNSCADAGVQLSGFKLPATVENVRLGSPASYSGIQKNDKVLQGKIDDDQIHLLIERNGQRYSIKLATVNKGLKGRATDDGSQLKGRAGGKNGKYDGARVEGGVEKLTIPEIAKKLRDWQIVLVIDKSQSMSLIPPSMKISKWAWCRNSIKGFADVYQSPMDIVVFDDEFSVMKNCNASAAESVFLRKRPSGNTNLAKPIKHILSQYGRQSSGKPLLIAVITDGVISAGPKLEDVLVKEINSIPSHRKIAITFLDIGGNAIGGSLMQILDDGLVMHGAKRDVVDTKYFYELKKVGLARALAYAISPEPAKPVVSDDLKKKIREAEKELKLIRQQIKGTQR